jgi:hypothetical protein
MLGTGELRTEGHREATADGGSDQLFRVGADAFFKACLEAVLGVFEGVALGGDGAVASLQAAVPDDGSVAIHLILLCELLAASSMRFGRRPSRGKSQLACR